MIYDSDDLSLLSESRFDVCIVGGGAAGITIAQKLDPSLKVCILEAGGLQPSTKSQEVYNGEVVGDTYFPLIGARLRYFGGSTGHWAGMCRGFEDVDFDRSYLGNHLQWPIKKSDLDLYLDSACEILEIKNDFNDISIGGQIRGINFNFSPPVRFGDKYRKVLKDSKNVSVFLNANFVDVNESGLGYIVDFCNYRMNKIHINCDKVIFAMGGIENSRYLLHIDSQKPGLLFDNGLPIGEYWMEHPHFSLGEILVDKRHFDHAYVAVSADVQRDVGILNCGFRINPLGGSETQALIREIACYAPELSGPVFKQFNKHLLCGFKLRAAWEQEPRKQNKVELNGETDRFGTPQVRLKWEKSALDFKTVRKSLSVLSNNLIEKDIGRLRLFDWLTNGEFTYPDNDELAGFHHMGGTRMHASPRYGVVDGNGKIFGSRNLYVAGSSLFTTGGHNNPTLPIVQLSLRLANHLNELV